MKKAVSILFFALCLIFQGKAVGITLTENAEISILTCSEGAELYSLFGHSAIHVRDAALNIDWVFNYGTFDFGAPHFYTNFIKGYLMYYLSLVEYNHFVNAYIREGRSIWSQTLQLNYAQKQKLFDSLLTNYEPENRTYLYNFLFDNCSTRIRDIVEKSVEPQMEWNLADDGKSYWNLLDEYLVQMPWAQWGVHTILGQSGSKKAQPHEYMFLPDYLLKGFDSATLNGREIAGKTQTLYQAPPSNVKNYWFFSPLFVFTFLSLMLIFMLQYIRSQRLVKFIAFVLLLLSGAAGLLFVYLSWFSLHPITAPNFNLLWGNPLNLAVLPFLFFRRMPKIVRGYLFVYMIIMAIGVPVWFFLMPAVPLASLPLFVLLIFLCLKLRAIRK